MRSNTNALTFKMFSVNCSARRVSLQERWVPSKQLISANVVIEVKDNTDGFSHRLDNRTVGDS